MKLYFDLDKHIGLVSFMFSDQAPQAAIIRWLIDNVGPLRVKDDGSIDRFRGESWNIVIGYVPYSDVSTASAHININGPVDPTLETEFYLRFA